MRVVRAHILLSLGLATLALRALIPLGYMPGNLLIGEFAVLCPEGVPEEVMQILHRGHHDHDADVVNVDQSCPIGSALQLAWLPAPEPDLLIPDSVSDRIEFYPRVTYREIHKRRYEPRGPPRA